MVMKELDVIQIVTEDGLTESEKRDVRTSIDRALNERDEHGHYILTREEREWYLRQLHEYVLSTAGISDG